METFQSDMCSEFKRYATFNGFQTPPGVWPLQLAQAGFYRSATCPEFQVVCFACGLSMDVRNVRKGSVMEIHRRLSPTCSFVSGSANNQPVPAVDPGAAMELLAQSFGFGAFEQQEENEPRFHSDSMTHMPQGSVPNGSEEPRSLLPNLPVLFPEHGDTSTLPQLPIISNINTLEQPGLPSLPSGLLRGLENATLDSVQSSTLLSTAFRGPEEILVTDGEPVEAEGSYPTPPMAQSEILNYTQMPPPPTIEELGEVLAPQKLTFGDLGIIIDRPKRQEFVTYQKRLQTFERWRGQQISQSKELIAEAGFYYAGMHFTLNYGLVMALILMLLLVVINTQLRHIFFL